MRQLPRQAFTIAALLAFLGGIAAGFFFEFAANWLLAAAAIFGVGGILIRRWQIPSLVAIILAGASLGFARFELAEWQPGPGDLAHWNQPADADRKAAPRVEIRGFVAAEPDNRADHSKLTVAAESIQLAGEAEPRPIAGLLLAKAPRWPELKYGDEVELRGLLTEPFETEEFSYKNYLALREIRSTMSYPSIEKTGEGRGNPVIEFLLGLKTGFENEINRLWHEPVASLMAGLITGSRRGMPESVVEDFNATGLTHIVAISGANIALVIAIAVALVGRYLPRKVQFPVVAGFVIAFTLFVGAGAPVVRAAIMGLIAFFALTAGRQGNAAIALLASAAIMVAWQPLTLIFDVSFQLSFAAVAGLIWIAPLLEPALRFVPRFLAIRESLMMTLAAQLSTVPLILLYFDRVSFIAPLANVAAAPAVPLAMLGGGLASLLGLVNESLGLLAGTIPNFFAEYILWIAREFARIPGAELELANPVGVGIIAGYYTVLIAGLILVQRLRMRKEAEQKI